MCDRMLAGKLIELARTKRVFLSPETAEPPALGGMELFGSSIVFLAYPFVQPRAPCGPGELGEDDVCVSLVLTQERRELLAEVVPGGRLELLEGPWRKGSGAGLYIMTRDLRPKVGLCELRNLIEGLEEVYRLGRARQAPQALAAAEALAAKYPAVGEVQCELGVVLYEAGRIKEARVAAERAMALTAGRGSRALSLGGLVAAAGDEYERAVDLWRRSLILDPHQERVWFNLALAFAKGGERGKATECIRRGLVLFPASVELRKLAGLI